MNKKIKLTLQGKIVLIILALIFLLILKKIFSSTIFANLSEFIIMIGIIALGYIAIKSSTATNRMAKELMSSRRNKDELAYTPFIMMEDYKAVSVNMDTLLTTNNQLYIDLEPNNTNEKISLSCDFINTSETFTLLSFTEASGYDDTGVKRIWNNDNPLESLPVKSGSSVNVSFIASKEYFLQFIDHPVTLEFSLTNRLGEAYKETFDLYILSLNKDIGYMHSNEYYCRLSTKKYKTVHA